MNRRKSNQPLIIGGIVAGVVVVLLVIFLPPYLRVRQARHDVATLQTALMFYIRENGAVPDGTLAEVASLLRGNSIRGQNSQRLDYIEAEMGEMNVAGEFIDPWGTPYRMDLKSAGRIYSCGPNRQDENGAGDDIVVQQ